MNEPTTPPPSRDRDAALARLVERHAGFVFHLALRFCGNRDDAEDLVQEVFLAATNGWDGFRGESSETTWLYRIAARACGRMHRRRAGEPATIASLDELLPFDVPRIAALPDGQDDVVQQQIRREAVEAVEAAIPSLPDDFRVPLVLKELVGLTVREVADVLDLPEATVRTRVHRARLVLRAAVDGVVPRAPGVAPPPAYPAQTCLDLLDAKQQALDRGVPFDDELICARCASVFATLDLTQDAVHALADGSIPDGVRERLVSRLAEAGVDSL